MAKPKTTKRETYDLTPVEINRFEKLRTEFREGYAFSFWKDVAAARGLAYETILAARGLFGMVLPHSFTALPLGWRRQWCYPDPVKCPRTVAQAMAEVGR